MTRREIDGLALNYAWGFTGGDIGFLEAHLGVRRLHVLDRRISNLGPIARLADSLEELTVEVAEEAELDLSALLRLRLLAGEWGLLRPTLGSVDALESLSTWGFDEEDLHAFRDHLDLRRLTIKGAPYLESLSGAGDLPELAELGIFLAPRLHDLSDVGGLAASLRELELEDCAAITALDEVDALRELRFLGASDCGDIESLAPVRGLERLEMFHAWGSTRVLDADLSPLAELPLLREVRMRDRRGYRPSVADLVSALSRRPPK